MVVKLAMGHPELQIELQVSIRALQRLGLGTVRPIG